MDIKITMLNRDILPISVREEKDGRIVLIVGHAGSRGENRIEIELDQSPETVTMVAASLTRAAARLLDIQTTRNELKGD